MKILIHACPQRMWYVNDFLVPMLREQDADNIEIWNDVEHKGNLKSCMDSFAARTRNGGTWHIQDDVLPCRDFVKRCEENDEGLVYGFCCRNFNDRINTYGRVLVPDMWNSFQCVRIPDEYARGCAEWVYAKAWETESTVSVIRILFGQNKGDDTFFHEYMISRHPSEWALNLKPNLVEHIDFLIGGSAIRTKRNYSTRAEFFEDSALIEETAERIKRYKAQIIN